MKIWTQEEFEAARRGGLGRTELGTGDFSNVDFRGVYNITIGAMSIIGRNAHVGARCVIGSHCAVMEGFHADGALKAGEHCHFGEGARIGKGSIIGSGCCFASGAEIGEGTQIEDDVRLPACCTLFGVKNADGRTMTKLCLVDGSMLYAFAAEGKDERVVWVCMKQRNRTLEEFEDFAADQATMHGMTGTREFIADGHQLLAAAKYIRARFSLMQLCAAFRRGM